MKPFEQTRIIAGIDIKLPKPPPIGEIVGFELPTAKQCWLPRPIPSDDTLRSMPQERLDAFVSEEWRRRRDGFWFFNNGNIEYITGAHYFYLTYWRFPVFSKRLGRKILGLPSFTDADRDFFYLWEHCMRDKNCYGLIYLTGRRKGKTFKSTCVEYEYISRNEVAIGGIQSKNETDAKKVFKKLVRCWQKLPFYFKPIDVGETDPNSALRFFEPSKRDTKSQKKKYSRVLESEINYGTAKEGHYDGEGLAFIYHDEIGKAVECNVSERWNIVKECLGDSTNITGKGLLTSTVEEMKRKGGENCKKIWDRSDQSTRTGIGQTESGLYRYFEPDDYGYRGDDGTDDISFVDEYGYSNRDAARAYHAKRAMHLTGESLLSERRKHPLSESDLWRMENKNAVFDLTRIYQQMEHNESLKFQTIIKGNFMWVERPKKARFVESPNGRWKLIMRLKEDEANRVTYEDGLQCPVNKQCVSGCDPFDHSKTDDYRRSSGASHVYVANDPKYPDFNNVFISEYFARPPKSIIFYEDIAMQIVYFSTPILIETQKIGLINHLKEMGLQKYIMFRPESTHTEWTKKHMADVGISTSGLSIREQLVSGIRDYIYDFVGWLPEKETYGKFYFSDTLDEWTRFEPEKWTPFDRTVSVGLTLLAAKKKVRAEEEERDENDYYEEFYVRGGKSVRADKNFQQENNFLITEC